MGHHSLRRGERNIPHRDHRDGGHINDPVSRETGNDHADRAEKLADVKCAPFTEPRHDSPSKAARNGRREDPHDRERSANHGLAPLVTVNRVERPNHEDFVRDVGKKL